MHQGGLERVGRTRERIVLGEAVGADVVTVLKFLVIFPSIS